MTVMPVRSSAELDAASRSIPDDFEFGCPADGGKDLVDTAQNSILDQVLGAVATLRHRKTLQNDDRVVGCFEGQIADDPVHAGSAHGALERLVRPVRAIIVLF